MIKRLFFIILWVAFAAILHLFGNNSGTFVILAASIVAPVLSWFSLLLMATRLRPVLTLPETCAKGEDILGAVSVQHGWLSSIFEISCTLVCENRFTGGLTETQFALPNNRPTPFTLQTSHCGVLHVYIKETQIYDPLGIFTRRIAYSTKQYTIIQPLGRAVEVPSMDTAHSMDSDEYSATKAGMDVSETYAIREYQPGDPIRSIHWKLSEKLDKTMVREFGLPIGTAVLLVLKGTENVPPDGWDTAAELFYSTGLVLLNSGVRTTMGWAITGIGFVRHEIHTHEDAQMAMCECMLTIDRHLQLVPEHNTGEQVIVVKVGTAHT